MRPYESSDDYGELDTSHTEVSDGLFLGGLASLATLPLARGSGHVLVVCARELCESAGEVPPGFSEMLLRGFDDVDHVPVELVERAADEVVARRAQGKSVLVICAEGRNRSALVMAVALKKRGCPYPVKLLRDRRHPGVLDNKTFAAYAKAWPGERMTLERFVEECELKHIGAADGWGCYVAEGRVTDRRVAPSDVMSGQYDSAYSHVVWFNK